MRHRSRAALRFAVVALAAIGVAASGCSNQGEGERCTAFGGGNTSTNGTQECQDGLVCMPGSTFPPATGTYDRCCPPTQADVTVQACVTSTGFGGSNTAGREGAGVDGAAPDANTEDVDNGDAAPGDAGNTDSASDGAADSASD